MKTNLKYLLILDHGFTRGTKLMRSPEETSSGRQAWSIPRRTKLQIKNIYLFYVVGIGLTAAQTSFACTVSGSGEATAANYLGLAMLVIGAGLFFVPIIFYILRIKRGNAKKRLIKYWGWAFF